MEILFIYPSTLHAGQPVKYRKAFLPPLNLALLDRLTEMADPRHEVKIINDFVEPVDFDTDCDLVGITALTSQAGRAYQIAEIFRRKGKKVILGGVHPSLLPREAIRHADAVAIGEVENLWSDILSDAECGRMKQFYQDDGYPALDKLMLPKWDHMDMSIYRRSIGRNKPRMPIYTTRGCVHNCKYCSVSKFFGRSYRYKPIANVLKEIEHTGTESFFFTDDNIICAPDYSESLFDALKRKKYNIRWMSQASTRILKKPRLIEMAAEAGCRSMLFGVESINRSNLESVKKGFNHPDEYIELYRTCYRAGIQPWFSMIFGMDHDTVESMRETARFLIENKILNVVFWILTPLPGTDLYSEMIEAGRVTEPDWSKYDLNHVVYHPLKITPEALHDNFWKIFQSFYTVPVMMQRAMQVIRNSDAPVKSLVRSLVNQYGIRIQTFKNMHPYSMGIFRKSQV